MWTVRETWTKFTYPIISTKSEIPLDQITQSFLQLVMSDDSTRPQRKIWNEYPYNERELYNLSPYVKRYLELPVNQRRLRFDTEILDELGVFQSENQLHYGPGFRFSNIDLHLFFNGIGILVIEVCPDPLYDETGTNKQTLKVEWIEDVNSALASIGREIRFKKTNIQNNPTLNHQEDRCTMRSIAAGQAFYFSDFITDVLLAPCQMNSENALYQAAVDTFLPAFGALLIELNEDTVHLRGKELADSFGRFVAEHLTVLRKTLPSDSANVLAQHVFGDPEHNYMPYHNVIHSQSLEGGFVVAFDNGSPHYHTRPAPAMASFRTHYFNMILMALHQRLSILKYTMAAAEASLQVHRFAKLQLLREQIYDFTSRCYFTQVSMSEERDQLYRRWQRAFHVLEMFDGLKEEVAEIQGYLAGRIAARETEQRALQIRNENARTLIFMYITVLFLPITVVLNVITASPVWLPWLNFHTHPIRAWILICSAFITALFIALEATRMWRSWRNKG